MLERLRAVEWNGDWDDAFKHVMSRRLLMREYLRRATLWAEAYSAESSWPFFDITKYVDPNFQLPPDITDKLDEFLRMRLSGLVKTTCAGAVRLAELRFQQPAVGADGLPDLYEPLVLMYERGGEFMRDNAGALDLTGVSFRPGTLQNNAGSTPIVSVSEAVLDALDAEGRVTFYAADSGEERVLRRRVLPGGEQHEEVFSGRLGWNPTERLHISEEDSKETGCVRIGDQEAARLIETAVLDTPRATGQS